MNIGGENWQRQLSALLITPVQRIPRYVLLLRELIRCTPHDREEYNNLQAALVEVSRIAGKPYHLASVWRYTLVIVILFICVVLCCVDYVNETKRLSENKRRVTEIASKVAGSVNLAPTLISGWIWKRSKTLKQWRRRYVVLSGDELSYYKQIDENMKPEVIRAIHHQSRTRCTYFDVVQ